MDGTNWYSYCGSNPIRMRDRNGLWKEDVHKDDTTKWAKEVGFSDSDATIIGEADNGVDSGDTGPFPGQDPSRHFNTSDSVFDTREIYANECYRSAVKQWNKANEEYEKTMAAIDPRSPNYNTVKILAEKKKEIAQNNALKTLGEGLHSLQDIEAHGNFGTKARFENVVTIGHAYNMKADDKNYDWTNDDKNAL